MTKYTFIIMLLFFSCNKILHKKNKAIIKDETSIKYEIIYMDGVWKLLYVLCEGGEYALVKQGYIDANSNYIHGLRLQSLYTGSIICEDDDARELFDKSMDEEKKPYLYKSDLYSSLSPPYIYTKSLYYSKNNSQDSIILAFNIQGKGFCINSSCRGYFGSFEGSNCNWYSDGKLGPDFIIPIGYDTTYTLSSLQLEELKLVHTGLDSFRVSRINF